MTAAVYVQNIGPNHWFVTIDGRAYSAHYRPYPDVFPLDRWRVRNVNRLRWLAWDSPTRNRVVDAIRRDALQAVLP